MKTLVVNPYQLVHGYNLREVVVNQIVRNGAAPDESLTARCPFPRASLPVGPLGELPCVPASERGKDEGDNLLQLRVSPHLLRDLLCGDGVQIQLEEPIPGRWEYGAVGPRLGVLIEKPLPVHPKEYPVRDVQ